MGEGAPADLSGKLAFFSLGRSATFGFDLLEKGNGFHIGPAFGFERTCVDPVGFHDMVVLRVAGRFGRKCFPVRTRGLKEKRLS